MLNIKRQAFLSLSYFLLVALLGGFLRLFFITNIPANYRYIVHTHSHIALLGWVYTALCCLLYLLFLKDASIAGKYKKLLIFTHLTLLGMLVSFPLQGYAVFSIIFSTLFLFASYWFTHLFLRHTPQHLKSRNSYKVIRFSLIYLIISSIGPWALGVIMNTYGSGSVWYRIAIYFYLHFQYNGWFMLALLGILLFLLETRQNHIPMRLSGRFFILLNLSVILTFFLSTLWTNPHWSIYGLSAVGSLLQIVVFSTLIAKLIRPFRQIIQSLSNLQLYLIKLVFVLFIIKIVMQSITTIPYFAEMANSGIDLVIGYLHLVFIGVISILLFFFLNVFGLSRIPSKAFSLFFFGLITSELLIFSRGLLSQTSITASPLISESLVWTSLLMPIGLFLIWRANIRS